MLSPAALSPCADHWLKSTPQMELSQALVLTYNPMTSPASGLEQVRWEQEKPYILAFSPELVAEQLTLIDAVSVLAGRAWVGLLLDSGGQSCKSWANFQSRFQLQHCTTHYQGHFLKSSVSIPLWRVEKEFILRVTRRVRVYIKVMAFLSTY
jgi:hypothetical protein